MPLALDDPRWKSFATAYNRIEPTLAALERAYRSGMTDDDLGVILNEVHHQGDITDALYAVAPHFVEIAQLHPGKVADEMIIHLGIIHGETSQIDESECPDFLHSDYLESRERGLTLLLKSVPAAKGFDDVKYRLNAIAGFLGEGRLGEVLYDLELSQEQLWLSGMDGPLEGY